MDTPTLAAAVALVMAALLLATGCTLTVESSDTDDGVDVGVDLGETGEEPGAGDSPDADSSAGGALAPPAAEAEDRVPVDPPQGAEPVTIDRVIDGDSLEVSLADGSPAEVRMEGINAPELNAIAGGRTCAGEAARAELTALLSVGEVTLTGEEFDRFDRLLARLHVDGHPVELDLIAAGWALALWSAEDPAATAAMFAAAEAGRGWWGDGCGPPAADALAIGATQANAPGDDRENLDQEWVELVNEGDTAVDLSGWVLRDETTSNRFLLDGVTIDPGETLRVVTGRGGGDVELGEDFPVWSNNGETVLLVDPEGVIAAWAFLGG
ncbi:MAG: lamin tail domain-containing protein [Actinomycetota bacterium]